MVDTITTLAGIATLAVAGLVVAVALLWAAARFSPAAAGLQGRLVAYLGGQSLWLAWLVALAATVGSLYYSEVANFEPCSLCWYQRIAMYPLLVILLVGALTRDRFVARYALPLTIGGSILAIYNYLVQLFPGIEVACSRGVVLHHRRRGLRLADHAADVPGVLRRHHRRGAVRPGLLQRRRRGRVGAPTTYASPANEESR